MPSLNQPEETAIEKNSLLAYFRQMGDYTNPQEYAEMYEALPTDLTNFVN